MSDFDLLNRDNLPTFDVNSENEKDSSEKEQLLIDRITESVDKQVETNMEKQNGMFSRAGVPRWVDFVHSGMWRSVAGPVQFLLSSMENGHFGERFKIPEGSTRDFTHEIHKTEELVMGLPPEEKGQWFEELIRDTFSQGPALAIETMLTAQSSIPGAMVKGGSISAVGGFLTFQEDPKYATSTANRLQTGLAAGATSTVLTPVSSYLGRAADHLFFNRGKLDIMPSNIRPDADTLQEGVEIGRLAQQEGLTVTPAGAIEGADEGVLTHAQGKHIEEVHTGAKTAADVSMENKKVIDEKIDSILRMLVPEGMDINAAVTDIYNKAFSENLPKGVFQEWMRNDFNRKLVNAYRKKGVFENKAWNERSGEVGKLMLILESVKSDQVETTAQAGAKTFEKKLRDLLSKHSASFTEATLLGQRNIIRKKLRQKIGHRIDSPIEMEDFTEFDEAEIARLMASGKGREEAIKQIEKQNQNNALTILQVLLEDTPEFLESVARIKDPKIRKAMVEKISVLRQLLPALQNLEKFAKSTQGKAGVSLKERSMLENIIVFTGWHKVIAKNNDAFIDFVLNPRWAADDFTKKMGTTKFLTKAGKLKKTSLKDLENMNIGEIESFFRNFTNFMESLGRERQWGSDYVPELGQEEDKTAYSKDTSKQKRAWAKLEKSGNLERFAQANPEAFEKLRRANTTRAMV